MNISRNKKVKVYTKDKHLIKGGEIVYFTYYHSGMIIKFKVKHWNDGRTANINFAFPGSKKLFVNIVGYGGRGLYEPKEDNVFIFYPARSCFKSLDKARNFLKNKYKKTMKQIYQKEPVWACKL